MKELSIEEKAKAYDEALERVENIKTGKCKTSFIFTEGLFEHIFPELKESEDERIRKELIRVFTNRKELLSNQSFGDIAVSDILAWLEKQGQTFTKKDIDDAYLKGVCDAKHELEKQGKPKEHDVCDNCEQQGSCVSPCCVKLVEKNSEQKPADKVEPKFKVGDWVVYECGEETATLQIARIVEKTYVFSDDSDLNIVDEDTLRLWDITKDAKDGDVLKEDSCTFIINKMKFERTAEIYCCLFDDGDFDLIGSTLSFDVDSTCPATKEQRDLLFQKMKEAGYEWDAEKKELRKISQEYPLTPDECIKPAWSEEDIETFERIISNYEYFCNTLTLEENWSETEKEACKKVDYEDIKWLKSLKDRCLPQPYWKPSEEQLTSLAWVIEYGNTYQTETLKRLLEQLKTL